MEVGDRPCDFAWRACLTWRLRLCCEETVSPGRPRANNTERSNEVTDLKWEVGDVVVLKSDPVQRMTVMGVGVGVLGDKISTSWFLDGKLQEAVFPPDALEKADD